MSSSSSLPSNVICQEITFECSDGVKLAGQKWENKKSSPTSGGNNGSATGYYGNNSSNMMMMGGYGNHHHGAMNGGGFATTTTTSTTNTNSNKRMIRILCVHGFYDNCRSFYQVAPQLIDKIVKKYYNPYGGSDSTSVSIEIVAIDLPGHGKSATAAGAPTIYLECVYYLAETIRYLKWWNDNTATSTTKKKNDSNQNNKIILIGHSFGASVSLGYAATFPEQITKLILLDRGTCLTYIYIYVM
jgi:pimeloyl-ACP methyl ester carboxylesterase